MCHAASFADAGKEQKLQAALGELAKAVSASAFLGGATELGLADIAVFCTALGGAAFAGVDVPAPVSAYLEKLAKLEAVKVRGLGPGGVAEVEDAEAADAHHARHQDDLA